MGGSGSLFDPGHPDHLICVQVMTDKLRREEAIALRRSGLSHKAIIAKMGVARSTLSYWLRDITLSDEQQSALNARASANRQDFVAKMRATDAAERHRRSVVGGKTAGAMHAAHLRGLSSEDAAEHMTRLRHMAMLTYRADELPTKAAIERYYGSAFQKEIIGRRAIDFANESMLIEHTTDRFHGISDVIARFGEVGLDPRRKIAFVRLAGLWPKAKRQMAELGVELHDVSELETLST